MNWIAIGIGAIISILILTGLIKLIKATVKTAVIIAALVFALHFFGIGPGNLIQLLLSALSHAPSGQ